MRRRRKVAIWITAATVLAGILAAVLTLSGNGPLILKGAIISADPDPNKQLPLGDVEVTAADGLVRARSDPSGYFRIALPTRFRAVRSIALEFRRAGYEPSDLTNAARGALLVVRMVPIPEKTKPVSGKPQVVVGNVTIRYSEKTTTTVNVGSGVKTFQVVNQANEPCNGRPPCSPDGEWKAAIGSASLDAGEGNEFQNARVSCIAGPCPFTKIESDNFSRGGRTISVSVRNWSDTTTFLLEAEVFHPLVEDVVRNVYPVIFGRALNFSLPPHAEGTSLQAELSGTMIVFPLGPSLCLSWADCTARVDQTHAGIYRCELKPDFRF